jgi:hypothetical protein
MPDTLHWLNRNPAGAVTVSVHSLPDSRNELGAKPWVNEPFAPVELTMSGRVQTKLRRTGELCVP